jgi:superfamily I DNA/RNA helicase
LSSDFRVCPGLAHIIAHDWELIEGSEAPHFVGEMRGLAKESHIPFYLGRGNYYDAVDFDDIVYRAYMGLTSGYGHIGSYDLVLIDEYQDFNRLEAGIVDIFGEANPIVIAGDDDQALYSQLRNASWDYIRSLSKAGEFVVFELPFCIRCPKVVVDAVRDVLTKAHEIHRLEGRIDKPYKHFPPVKGADSAKYPKIAIVETSVQRKNVNYMGRFIAQEVAKIPGDEIETAVREDYPVALVIVAKPYREQIIAYLEDAGFKVETRSEPESDISRDAGLSILKENQYSNLGWRIVLEADRPSFLREVILATVDGRVRHVDALPGEYREVILAQAAAYNPPEEQAEAEGPKDASPAVALPVVRVTSFEGSKGMSAQHVFIAGLHDGELPHNPAAIMDLEICKFVVGLTRTRKKCSLIYTRRFGDSRKFPSSFISWINGDRLDFIRVNKSYWSR